MQQKLQHTFALALAAIFACAAIPAAAQQANGTVRSGRITDAQGRPLAGVAVQTMDGRNGTSTGTNGQYQLTVENDQLPLTAWMRGYRRDTLQPGAATDIVLKKDVHHLDEPVYLGYTSTTRRALTGAVATVSGEELERAPVANLSMSFAGRLPGLFTHEASSELSRAATDMFIRGQSSARKQGPLVIMDGTLVSYNSQQTLEYITASEIESVSVLKDAAAQALYGIQGANGIIVVTTKRGGKGPLKVDVRLDQSVQEVTTRPTWYNSYEYASMRNQAAKNDGRGDFAIFNEAQMEGFRTGSDRNLYPENNWYDRYMRDFARMERVNVSLNGGNDRVQFFSNLNVMHQGGQWNIDTDKYKSDANNIWANYRSNLDMNLHKYIKAFLRLSGNIKRERTPGSGNSTVYSSLFQMPSTTYGPLTPLITGSSGKTNAGDQVVTTEKVGSPTYGMLNRSGYYRHTVVNINSQVGVEADLSWLTKGLSLTGTFAYQTNSVGSLSTTQNYERYMRTDRRDTLAFVKKGGETNTPLSYGKTHSYYYNLTYHSQLDYSRDFGKHHIGATAFGYFQNLTTADNGAPGMLPYNRLSLGGEVAYSYGGKYFLQFDLGRSGSEQYARDVRFTTTPAVSAAWLVTGERWMEGASWLSLLKLRGSWGKTANDRTGLSRFAYLDNVTFGGGGPLGYLQYNITENLVGNPGIRAEVSTKRNGGIDLGLFNAIHITADVFNEEMTNMVVGAVNKIPQYQGIPLGNYPRTNMGVFRNKGFEISASFSRQLNRDWGLNIGGWFAQHKNTIVSWNEAKRAADYAYRNWEEGYSLGTEFGYVVDNSNGNGYFNSQEEITRSGLTYSFGTPRPGDLKYTDLNGDKIIDQKDKAPMGYGSTPRQQYAINGGVKFRTLELNFLFQGTAKYATSYSGMGVRETEFDGVYGSIHRNAWTAERYAAGEPISHPALSMIKTVNHETNTFYFYDRSYLRLKNVELMWTLPESVSKKLAAQRLRVLLSGQNLLTWDKLPTSDFGPESGGYGAFPVYRVFNAGVQLQF
ncbi:SusC/RagA family TonB-linked outer membrane protein [Chitinophaga deserti]|uniref:SusC/RagA family TonB-linked outer membrane protein n=1 Tax=Chitinophaga deserti TaxID=2164099 RepID=UPI000D6C8413|nr:SusC/RagA family TonB-linked outer membrane protein [Chitinophaga deserti]